MSLKLHIKHDIFLSFVDKRFQLFYKDYIHMFTFNIVNKYAAVIYI